jgi:SPX domain protein involved in polyphosphate accumulation
VSTLQGVHKILKKHDKMLPHAPCRQFYIAHLHQQPWVQGNYSDVLVHLSNCYSQLRGDISGDKNEDAAQVGPAADEGPRVVGWVFPRLGLD